MQYLLAMTFLRPSFGRIPVLLAIFAASCGQPGSTSSSTPTTAPPAAPVPAAQVFVADETGGNLVIVDAGSGEVRERIAVGKRPRGLRISPDHTLVYVALSGSPIGGPGVDESKLPPADRTADGIGVVDIAGKKVLRLLKSGQDPESFDISPDGKIAYVSNEDAAEVTVLDLTSGAILKHVKVGEEPEGVRVRPDGKVVYVTCEGTNEVKAIDTSSYAVLASIKMDGRPRSVEFTRDGLWAFVTNENGASVSVVDATAHKTAGKIDIPKPEAPKAVPADPEATPVIPPLPMGLVLSPDGSRLYVSLGRAKSVAVIDVAARKVLNVIADVGTRPWGIGISPDGTKLFTANGRGGDISIIDAATGAIDKRVSTGGSPWGIAVLPPASAR